MGRWAGFPVLPAKAGTSGNDGKRGFCLFPHFYLREDQTVLHFECGSELHRRFPRRAFTLVFFQKTFANTD